MKYGVRSIGIICALLAAIFNGTVGVFSVGLYENGLSSEDIAFLKCLIALLVVGFVLVLSKKTLITLKYFKEKYISIAICSFFGFFTLYFFETAAYKTTNISVVVFFLFGVSTLVTFIGGAIIEKRFFRKNECFSFILALIGIYFVFLGNFRIEGGSYGLIYSCIAGAGYGLFIVLSKKLSIGSGFSTIFSLLIFGCIYLFVPFAVQYKVLPYDISTIMVLVVLAILPTAGGFWLTTKAIDILEPKSVQLIELTEPIFAIIFSFIFLSQLITLYQVIGGVLIIAAIVISEYSPKKYVELH